MVICHTNKRKGAFGRDRIADSADLWDIARSVSSVLRIRQKQAKGKKLEKAEEEFYKANKSIIDLPKPETAEDRAVREYFEKWL